MEISYEIDESENDPRILVKVGRISYSVGIKTEAKIPTIKMP